VREKKRERKRKKAKAQRRSAGGHGRCEEAGGGARRARGPNRPRSPVGAPLDPRQQRKVDHAAGHPGCWPRATCPGQRRWRPTVPALSCPGCARSEPSRCPARSWAQMQQSERGGVRGARAAERASLPEMRWPERLPWICESRQQAASAVPVAARPLRSVGLFQNYTQSTQAEINNAPRPFILYLSSSLSHFLLSAFRCPPAPP
jgi:hypothetical protein